MSAVSAKKRPDRILDAAGELFIRYGYDKSTVSEIAEQAGVSKGSIYLHFESKEDLLEALILREMKVYAQEWLQMVEADPEGGSLAGMYKNSLYALDRSPFMAATLKQDGRVLGSYLRQPDNLFSNQPLDTRLMFVQMMQEAGAVRSDIDAKVIAHIMNMLAYGLVAMDEIMAREDIPATKDLIEGIATIMDAALMSKDKQKAEAGKAIVKEVADAALREFTLNPHQRNEDTPR